MRTTTITVRTDDQLRAALEKRASALGKSLSETVREILAEAVAERPLGERLQGLKGALRLKRRPEEPWRQQLRARNWRE